MPEYMINDVPVIFPFEPYSVQRAYMEKVIECLDKSTNGVLESPTGTGKTLSLLCSSLGWIMKKRRDIHANMEGQLKKMEEFNQRHNPGAISNAARKQSTNQFVDLLNSLGNGDQSDAANTKSMMGVPKIIYSSRTHSQISQAIQELKRTSYNHVKAAVIGSRDQLCIHPDLEKESNANKIQLCKIKVTARACHFHNRLEGQKDNPEFKNATVLDIEDIVRIGKKLKCCPYYASKELMDEADIVFMPYNYLLDPKIRKANKVDLNNTIVILDEAHNVEKMCEESASTQISSSDIAIAIEDVSHILVPMVENGGSLPVDMGNDEEKDFTVDDLVLLKEMLLNLERAIDEIPLKSSLPGAGETFQGNYIFEILQKANITMGNATVVEKLLDTLKQFLASSAEAKSSAFRRGGGLDRMQELLSIVFSSNADDFEKRVGRCYKVYIEHEQPKQTKGSKQNADGWMKSKGNATTSKPKSTAKLVSYWCFSPGFGMQHLLGKNVRSIILTSGTLAPLKPLISELDIPITVNLENPHIVNSSQVCVKIVSHGSDREQLNSNYENRGNPKYINSLGRTILSFCPVVPHGLLVFFPSYYNLNTCKEKWQESGIWSQIQRIKPIFIEPTSKEAFINTMTEYYNKISEPNSKGAIFMAVCRGKVSEGLDFADMNGRAVIITGLPFPPFKDPKVVLKKKYLTDNRTRENELLSGDDWYFLEASRAVNQAIGRVIRHRNDYGAILLCDCRFNNPRQKNQLSSWIQGHLRNNNPNQTFGSMIGEVAKFFKNAERTLPKPNSKPERTEDFSDTVDSFLKNEPVSSFQTISSSNSRGNFSSATLSQNVSVPKANEAFSLDMYTRKIPSKISSIEKKSTDLFSGLNETVKSIDFNNISGDSTHGQVTIHKRNRVSPTTSPGASQSFVEKYGAEIPKRKKYKIVPNSIETSNGEQSVTISTLVENDDPNSSISETELPTDRKELLKFIKNTLNPVKYKEFMDIFLEYSKNSNYKKFLQRILELFNQKRWFYIIKGMNRFVKPEHKQMFEKDTFQYMLQKS